MNSPRGIVYLVGAGPGDPGLVTVRGLDLLRLADVVVHDRLVPWELLRETKPQCEITDVGKARGMAPWPQERINDLIVERARAGLIVVRLKGGDPLVFGRGGEELAACRAAGIECVVVPGVSSALAAPAALGIPLTLRRTGQSFAVITGSSRGDSTLPAHDYGALARIDTLVLLMGQANLGQVCEALLHAGRDPQTPAACVASCATPAERVVKATLATIADAAGRENLLAPMVAIIGETAAFAAEQRPALGEESRLTRETAVQS